MPIEQLMAMYYTNEESEKPQQKTEESPTDTLKQEEEKEADIRKADGQTPLDEQANLDEDDPFQNQRITRGCRLS
jgi:hypothetical protein